MCLLTDTTSTLVMGMSAGFVAAIVAIYFYCVVIPFTVLIVWFTVFEKDSENLKEKIKDEARESHVAFKDY